MSDDPGGPAVILLDIPPGARAVPARQYGCDHIRVVLGGSCQIGGTSYEAGGLRAQNAGTVFGPDVTGPNGCRQCILVARRDAWRARYADPAEDPSLDWMTAIEDVLGQLVALA
jgi:hypothetical protein